MNKVETRYSAAVSLDGFYEVVDTSKGVKPYIGHSDLLGIDFGEGDVPVERLAIPEGTLEGSVVLIKGGQGGGENEIFRLFHVEVRALIEVERPLIGGWTFDQSDGNLVTDFVHGFLKVAPTDWGYCQIISELWSAESYIENALKQLGLEVPHGGIDWSAANYWKDLLSGSIKDRQRVEKTETALRQIAEKLRSHDLLDCDYDGRRDRGKTKGHLRATIDEKGGVAHCGSEIAKDLRKIDEMIQQTLLDLPGLSENALTG